MIETSEIQKAAAALKAGQLVAFPTETVYGLGADASNAEAVAEIYRVKQRPTSHPLIVHLHSLSQLNDWVIDVPDHAYRLAEQFWPGPLTLILKKHPRVSHGVTAGQETIGIRIPSHSVALALLKAFGGGVAAPSANLFTHVSPTTADAVRDELGNQIDWILDGGLCEVGLESTIIDLTQPSPRILRPGMLSATLLSNVLDQSLRDSSDEVSEVRVPGQHRLHYAPKTQTIYGSYEMLVSRIPEKENEKKRIAWITFAGLTKAIPIVTWAELSADPFEYAHHLYQVMHDLDKKGYDEIWIQSVPDGVEWDAIRDRLLKAAR